MYLFSGFSLTFGSSSYHLSISVSYCLLFLLLTLWSISSTFSFFVLVLSLPLSVIAFLSFQFINLANFKPELIWLSNFPVLMIGLPTAPATSFGRCFFYAVVTALSSLFLTLLTSHSPAQLFQMSSKRHLWQRLRFMVISEGWSYRLYFLYSHHLLLQVHAQWVFRMFDKCLSHLFLEFLPSQSIRDLK